MSGDKDCDFRGFFLFFFFFLLLLLLFLLLLLPLGRPTLIDPPSIGSFDQPINDGGIRPRRPALAEHGDTDGSDYSETIRMACDAIIIAIFITMIDEWRGVLLSLLLLLLLLWFRWFSTAARVGPARVFVHLYFDAVRWLSSRLFDRKIDEPDWTRSDSSCWIVEATHWLRVSSRSLSRPHTVTFVTCFVFFSCSAHFFSIRRSNHGNGCKKKTTKSKEFQDDRVARRIALGTSLDGRRGQQKPVIKKNE